MERRRVVVVVVIAAGCTVFALCLAIALAFHFGVIGVVSNLSSTHTKPRPVGWVGKIPPGPPIASPAEEGIYDVYSGAKLVTLDEGTKVKVVRNDGDYYSQIEVLSGPYKHQRLWIAAGDLVPAPGP